MARRLQLKREFCVNSRRFLRNRKKHVFASISLLFARVAFDRHHAAGRNLVRRSTFGHWLLRWG